MHQSLSFVRIEILHFIRIACIIVSVNYRKLLSA